MHVVQHIAHRVALDDLVDPPLAAGVVLHVRHMRVAEQVVQVAQRLLIGTHQEGAHVVALALGEVVQLHELLHVAVIHEAVDAAVRVAGDVGDGGLARGLLAQTVDGHDGEQLVNGPDVGQALEDAQVAEVGVAEQALQVVQLLRHLVHLAALVADAGAGGPEQVVAQRAVLQAEVAQAEQAPRLVAGLAGVVVLLDQATLGDALEGVEQLHQRTRQFFLAGLQRRQLRGHRAAIGAVGADGVEDEHALLRHHGATALGHDGRVRHAFLVAHAHGAIHHRGGVFGKRVVGAELEAGLTAVVVDAQATAHVQVLHAGAELDQLHVDARQLVHALVHLTHVVDLAAHVAMQQLQAVFHAAGAQVFEHLQHFAVAEAELGLGAA